MARASDWPSEVLAHARWSHQAQNGRLELVDALLHRQVLQNAFLDLLQAEVILVQHFLGLGHVLADLGLLLPRQLEQGVDVVAHHGGFRRHRRHHAQLLELGHRLFAAFLAHAGGLDLVFQLVEVADLVHLAELFLDRLDLLVQVVLALTLFHLPLDAAADALFHLQDVDLAFQLRHQMLEALLHIEHLQHFLLLLQLQRQVGDDGVGHAAGAVDAGQRVQHLGRDFLVQLDVLLELGEQRAAHRLGLGRFLGLRAQRLEGADEAFVLFAHRFDHRALAAFDQHLDGAVRQLEHLQYRGDGADLIQVVGGRLVLGGRALGHQEDLLALVHRQLQRADGFGAADEQRDHHMGKTTTSRSGSNGSVASSLSSAGCGISPNLAYETMLGRWGRTTKFNTPY